MKGRVHATLSLSGYEDGAVVDGSQPLSVEVMTDYAEGLVTIQDTTASGTRVLGSVRTDDTYGYQAAHLDIRLTAGQHRLTAQYAGNESEWPATSEPINVTATPDREAEISSSYASHSTVYPYKDGFRDSIAIRGDSFETLRITARIYSSTGSRIRTLSAGPTTAWSIGWNGRNDAGRRVPDGRYKVLVTARDWVGNTARTTFYVNVSSKRLYWYSASVTKAAASTADSDYSYGSAYDEASYPDVGSIRWPDTGITLNGGGVEDSYAYAAYGFRVPTANAYKLTFSVLGAPREGGGPAYLSLWNFATGTDDAARWASDSYGWSSTTTTSAAHVEGRQVWGYVTAVGSNYGWFDAAKVRLTYQYGLLK